jgi:MFS family permease
MPQVCVFPAYGGRYSAVVRKYRREDFSRNYIAFLVQVVGYSLGVIILSPYTIFPLFLTRLGASNFVIGLVPGVMAIGSYLPQLLVADFVQRLPRKRPYVLLLGFIERLAYLFMAGATILFWPRAPSVLVSLFFLCWGLNNLAIGLNSPAFFALFSKVVPADRRGGLFGLGGAVSATLGVMAAAWIARTFGHHTAPVAFAMIFAVGFAVQFVTYFPVGFVRESPDAIGEQGRTDQGWRAKLTMLSELLRDDSNLRNYIAAQIVFSVGMVARSFYTAYAVRKLGAGGEDVGVFTAIISVTSVLANLLWGAIADRSGHKRVWQLALIMHACAVLLVTRVSSMPGMWCVFGLSSAAEVGLFISTMNIVFEFCPLRKVPIYSALASTAEAPFRFLAAGFAGLVADQVGYLVLFWIALTATIIALGIVLVGVVEPRRKAAE